MRLALHLRITVPSLTVCMLLCGDVFAVIQPLAMGLIILVAGMELMLPQHRQKIETSYMIGLPLFCAFGALTGPSMDAIGEYLGLGLCGLVYGLAWFGLDPESRDSNWRRWTTAVPVLALAGSYLLIQARHAESVFHGPGLGALWIAQAALSAAVVVFNAIWRRRVTPTANWSFGAAVTLCLAVRVFQNLGETNAFDIALVFLPYAAGVITTLASRISILFHDPAAAEPVGEQLRPLG